MMTDRDERLRRVMLAVVLGILALPVLAFGVFWVWVELSREDPPEMFAGVPWDFREEGPWSRRMSETFPDGTPEAVLVERLREDGFEVDVTAKQARYDWNSFPCHHTVTAAWMVGAGGVTGTSARYMNACP